LGRYSNDIAHDIDWDSNNDPFFERFQVHLAQHTHPKTNEVHYHHPAIFVAKTASPDTVDYWSYLRLTPTEQQPWDAAMDKEMDELMNKGTFHFVSKSSVKEPIIDSTWVLRIKQAPDGRPTKYKARFCVRGDKQILEENDIDTYAPVVEWSTVRTMFTLTIMRDLQTRQIDFRNAFVQSKLPKPIYLKPPPNRRYHQMYSNYKDRVLKVSKSLYGRICSDKGLK
jgi:Reverse transcriptase (RNA-dependent DNA polymerase)